jgi:hypothetical protein
MIAFAIKRVRMRALKRRRAAASRCIPLAIRLTLSHNRDELKTASCDDARTMRQRSRIRKRVTRFAGRFGGVKETQAA